MFTLSVLTPTKRVLLDVPIEELLVPAYKGELNILPGHAPLVTTLSTGILRYRAAGSSEFKPIAISWGYCEVSPNGINVLAETAETPEEIDKERIHVALRTAEEAMTTGELNIEGVEKYRRKLERARIRAELLESGNETTH